MSYVSVVVDYFSTRRGSAPVLSPDDYAAIAEWEKQDIPLAFVLGSLTRIMDDFEARHNTIPSINELQGSVNMEFADSLRASVKSVKT